MSEHNKTTNPESNDPPPTWSELKAMVRAGFMTWAEAKAEWERYYPAKE